jgi:hypothetical protein
MASSSTKNLYKQLSLTSGGGTITLDAEEPFELFKVTGTATLAGSWVIQGSNLGVGQRFVLKYESVIDLNGNTITIFGKTIDQGLADRDFYIDAIYDGSAWNTSILLSFDSLPAISTSMIENSAITTAKILDDNVTNAKLANDSVDTIQILDDAVTTDKIADGAVGAEKLDANSNTVTLVIPVSFEAGEKCDNSIVIDFDCTIEAVTAYVTKVIVGTDDATVDVDIEGNPTTPATLTIPDSSALNYTDTLTIASANSISAGDVVSFVSAKTTSGGKALLSVKLIKV